MSAVQVIGFDCATDDKKIGIAVGIVSEGRLAIHRVSLCSRKESAASVVTQALSSTQLPTLIAVDAPLGWPLPLGTELTKHRAGMEIVTDPNEMFRRSTDRHIQTKLRKTPLDVGADRIARTAHSALRVLGDLRRRTGHPIPLAWSVPLTEAISAIEVYPAATLLSHKTRSTGYKAREQKAQRLEIIDRLHEIATVNSGTEAMAESADALDAAVCLVAAADFLSGAAMAPIDNSIAAVEGWIWSRPLPA